MSADSPVKIYAGARTLPPASLSLRSYAVKWASGLRLLVAVLLLCGQGSVQAGWAQSVSNLNLVPAGLTGGNTSVGTVTLSAPATTNRQVSLSTSNSAVTSLSPLTIPQGQTQGTFTVSTHAVAAQTTGTISASAGGGTASKTLNVYPPQLQTPGGLALTPDTTVGGQNITATITLDGPAPDGGLTINLTSSNTAFVALASTGGTGAIQMLPTTIHVPAGQSSFSFPMATAWADYTQSATVTATLGTQSDTETLTLLGANLRVTRMVGPNTLRLQWDGLTTSGQFLLTRNGTSLATLNASVTTYDDVFTGGYSSGTTYLYQLWDTSLTNTATSQISSESVVPYLLNASDNQAVDSRLDLRYSDTRYLDHCFGSTTYKGGLFAGFASDPSRVGRSFLRFSIPAPASGGNYFRTGGILAFCPGLATHTAASAAIGCQVVANNTWDFSTLFWTATNPTGFTPGAAADVTTIAYDPASPQPQWVGWNLPAALRAALNAATTNTPTSLTIALAGANESNAGWAYFAKNGYAPPNYNGQYGMGLGPRAAYVLAHPVPVAAYCIASADGTSAYYNIIMNGLNPGDTAGVALTSNGGGGSTASSVSGTITGLQHVLGAYPTGYTEAGVDHNYRWATANGVTVPIQMVNAPPGGGGAMPGGGGMVFGGGGTGG